MKEEKKTAPDSQKEGTWVYSCGDFYCNKCGAKALLHVEDMQYCYRCGSHMAAPWVR